MHLLWLPTENKTEKQTNKTPKTSVGPASHLLRWHIGTSTSVEQQLHPSPRAFWAPPRPRQAPGWRPAQLGHWMKAPEREKVWAGVISALLAEPNVSGPAPCWYPRDRAQQVTVRSRHTACHKAWTLVSRGCCSTMSAPFSTPRRPPMTEWLKCCQDPRGPKKE